MIIKPLELEEHPEKWFNTDYPTAHEIRENNDLIDLRKGPSLSEICKAIDSRKEDEGTIINQRIRPDKVVKRARPERLGSPGRESGIIEMPTSNDIWTYGDHINITPRFRSFEEAEINNFDFHEATESALLNANPNKPHRGIFLMSPYGRGPRLFPIVFNIQGCEYAYFELHFPKEYKEAVLNPPLADKIENYGQKSTVYVGSRSTPKRAWEVEIFKLATNEESKHADQLRTMTHCGCKHATVRRLYDRFSHYELIRCTHSAFALAVDEEGRKQTTNTGDIDLENKSPAVLGSTLYRPAGKIVRFNDKLQRKTLIRDREKIRRLQEIEHEILLDSYVIECVKEYGYKSMLNRPGLSMDMIIVKQNPYSFR